MTEHGPASARTTMKRGTNRAVYSPDEIRGVLQAGMIAHVGVTTEDGPIVLPMAYGVRGDDILIHGSIANAMLRGGRGIDVCITVTIVDGLVAPIWDTARPPSEIDYKQTLVLSVPLTEASAKIRGGDPIDDAEDIAGPHWAGVVPLTSTWGEPIDAADLNDGIVPSPAVVGLAGTDAHG